MGVGDDIEDDSEFLVGEGPYIGDCYPRLLREFISLAGLISDCPFNTPAHRYIGPVIRWTDGYPWMESGTPQMELFDEG